VTVNVTPGTANVTAGQTRAFTAVVAGAVNQAVTWSVQEGAAGGTISSGGVYTAPSGAGGPYHVVATSLADSSKIGTAIVMVTSAAPSWSTTSVAMPHPRFTHALGVSGTASNPTLFAWGGMANYSYTSPIMAVDAYDLTLGTWSTVGTWGVPGYFQAGLQVGTGLYMFGGNSLGTPGLPGSAVATWQQFSMLYSTWWAAPANFGSAMGTPRASPAVGRFGAFAMVSGGSTPGNTALATSEMADASGQWTPVASLMATGRYGHSAAVVGTRYYAIGGFSGNAAPLTSVEIYDTTSGWTPGPALPMPLAHSAVAVLNGRIYLMGGITSGVQVSGLVYALDTTAVVPAWVALPSLPVAVAYPAAVELNGKIYVVGGDIGGGSPAYPYVQVLTP
jgi:hypothetical protein